MPIRTKSKPRTTEDKKPDPIVELLNKPWHPKSQRPAAADGDSSTRRQQVALCFHCQKSLGADYLPRIRTLQHLIRSRARLDGVEEASAANRLIIETDYEPGAECSLRLQYLVAFIEMTAPVRVGDVAEPLVSGV